MSCGVLSLLGGVPGLLGGVLGAIVASDGDLGFFCNGVLGAGIADSTNDGLGFGSGCCSKLWSAICVANSCMAAISLAIWSSLLHGSLLMWLPSHVIYGWC